MQCSNSSSSSSSSRVEYFNIEKTSCICIQKMMTTMIMKKWKSHLKLYLKQTHPFNHNPHAVSIIMYKATEQENSNKSNIPNINITVSILKKMQQMSDNSMHYY
eukprot:1992017-Ditylum_brightwellii.AAC.1